MVISVATLQQLVTSDTCHCSAADAPDDMTLGLCLKHLDIDITHSPLFHQVCHRHSTACSSRKSYFFSNNLRAEIKDVQLSQYFNHKLENYFLLLHE